MRSTRGSPDGHRITATRVGALSRPNDRAHLASRRLGEAARGDSRLGTPPGVPGHARWHADPAPDLAVRRCGARSGGTAIRAQLCWPAVPDQVERQTGAPCRPPDRVGQLGQGGRVDDGVGVGVPVASAAAVPVGLPVASAAADDVGVPASVATPLGVCVPDDVGVGLGLPLGVGVQVGDGDGVGLVLVGLPLGVGVPGVLGGAVGVVGVVGVLGGVLGGAGLDGRVGGADVVGFGLPGARGVVVPGAAGGSPSVAGGSVGTLIGVDPFAAGEPSIGTPPA
jgi:hypothetical protein